MNFFKSIRNLLKRVISKRIPSYPYRKHNDATGSIFVHIPKAAGTSILSAIGAPERGRLHIDYTHFEVADEERYLKYFKFAVVRNPVDRLFSCYTYLLGGGNRTPDDLKLMQVIKDSSVDFDTFVSNTLQPNLIIRWPLLRPQVFYVCNKHLEVQMDMILRLENIEEDYRKLKEKLNEIAPVLPHVNATGITVSREISDASRKKIQRLYQEDFDLFYPSEKI